MNIRRITAVLAMLALVAGFATWVSLADDAPLDQAESTPTAGDRDPAESPSTTDATGPDEDVEVQGTTTTRLSDLDPNTFYVSADGNNSLDGQAPETATQDLQAAMNRLQPGQTLYLMDGTYYRSPGQGQGGHFRLAKSGNPGAPITIAAAPGHSPVVRTDQVSGFELVGSYLTIDGIIIRGEGYGPDKPFGFGVMAERGHHIEIRNMVISGMPLAGIGAIETSNMTIDGNVIFDNAQWGPEQGSGISIFTPVNLGQGPDADGYTDRVTNNIVFGNVNVTGANWRNDGMVTDGNGIIIDYSRRFGYSGSFLVANNIAANNGGRGIHVFKSDRVDVIHNTTYNNGTSQNLFPGNSNSELSAYEASQVRFLNNLVYSKNDGTSLTVRTWRADDTLLDGNVLVGDAPTPTLGASDLLLYGVPLYVRPQLDPRGADFTPLASSGAVGLGVETAVTTDINGLRRGPDPDAGALASSTAPAEPSSSPTTAPRTPERSPSSSVPATTVPQDAATADTRVTDIDGVLKSNPSMPTTAVIEPTSVPPTPSTTAPTVSSEATRSEIGTSTTALPPTTSSPSTSLNGGDALQTATTVASTAEAVFAPTSSTTQATSADPGLPETSLELMPAPERSSSVNAIEQEIAAPEDQQSESESNEVPTELALVDSGDDSRNGASRSAAFSILVLSVASLGLAGRSVALRR